MISSLGVGISAPFTVNEDPKSTRSLKTFQLVEPPLKSPFARSDVPGTVASG